MSCTCLTYTALKAVTCGHFPTPSSHTSSISATRRGDTGVWDQVALTVRPSKASRTGTGETNTSVRTVSSIQAGDITAAEQSLKITTTGEEGREERGEKDRREGRREERRGERESIRLSYPLSLPPLAHDLTCSHRHGNQDGTCSIPPHRCHGLNTCSHNHTPGRGGRRRERGKMKVDMLYLHSCTKVIKMRLLLIASCHKWTIY